MTYISVAIIANLVDFGIGLVRAGKEGWVVAPQTNAGRASHHCGVTNKDAAKRRRAIRKEGRALQQIS
jgi:hypothetical protein